ncbi:glycosyl transferase family 2 [Desulfatibacillum aliphaticivorans]|uniref:Glycosyl transferase family 2 n=1 Tax=Desulfatibacillum aliphaticivorans TaxID=218208 RepID=B8FMC2_DESAL|nr:glycosyltransferase family 2 protein [Desulfatibacillum aliphaticivorans]ACL05960.1 glycosyl transferase family 2 [Desulfatibacillum aliphaticivorans]
MLLTNFFLVPTHMNKDAQNQFKASVIIPVFNGQDCIANAIESILEQSVPDVEIIVVNDGSTDDTGAVCQKYVEKKQIVYQEQENLGRSRARNAGLKVARGEYIAFLDADDEVLPGSLSRRMEVLDKHPEASVVFSNFIVIDSLGRPPFLWISPKALSLLKSAAVKKKPPVYVLGPGYLKAALTEINLLPSTITFMARRETFDAAGVFDPSYPNAQDLHLWLRMAERFQFAFIDEALSKNYWDLHRPAEQRITSLSCRVRLFSEYKKGSAHDLAPELNLLIGKAHFDLGILLFQNRRFIPGISHMIKTLGYSYIYGRTFRWAPPLIFHGNPQPLISDVRRACQVAQNLLKR